ARSRRHRDGSECGGRHRQRVHGRRQDSIRGDALSAGHRAAQGRARDDAPPGGTAGANPLRVGLLLGGGSDLAVILDAVQVRDGLEVGSEVVVASAHRTPKKTEEYASTAEARGLGVLIAAAGGAAALPGVLAASSALPVIGVPIAATPLGGMDALL